MGVIDINKFRKEPEKRSAPAELPSLPEKEIPKLVSDAPHELPPIKDLPKSQSQSPPIAQVQQTVPAAPASPTSGQPQTAQRQDVSPIAQKTQEQIKQNIEIAQENMKSKPEPHDIVNHRNYKDSLFVEVQKNLSDPLRREEFEKSFLNLNPITEIKERINKASKDSMITEYEKVINEYVEKLKHLEGNWRKMAEEVDDRKKYMKKLEQDIDEKTFELKSLIMKLHEIRYEQSQ